MDKKALEKKYLGKVFVRKGTDMGYKVVEITIIRNPDNNERAYCRLNAGNYNDFLALDDLEMDYRPVDLDKRKEND